MKITTALTTLSLASACLVGCAAQSTTTAAQAPVNTFTGEVWTWDERENTVTLRRGTEDIRIKVAPEQIRGLQLHQIATIRGTVAPPAELPRFITPAVPMTAVPRGPVTEQIATGTVTAVDPSGRVSIDSDRGPLHVWVAPGAEQRFARGDRVQLMMLVQAVDMTPARAGAPASSEGAASPSSQPGDYAVVTGRIIGADPNGLLIVESPSGPIQVWVGQGKGYTVSQPVQVRTLISKAQ
jgi:hypothetical protein